MNGMVTSNSVPEGQLLTKTGNLKFGSSLLLMIVATSKIVQMSWEDEGRTNVFLISGLVYFRPSKMQAPLVKKCVLSTQNEIKVIQ